MNINDASNKACLTDENLYSYLTQDPSGSRTPQLEAHLAVCPKCRKALADLIELLHPELESNSEIPPAPTMPEIRKTVNLIQRFSRNEHRERSRIPAWIRWPIAAAAAISVLSVSFLLIRFYSEKSRAQDFFAQAKQVVDQSYTGASPLNLRLSLPFSIVSGMRDVDRRESLQSAEKFLYQALAIREDMDEARLGLGYIYLNGAEFEKAGEEFKSVLQVRKGDTRALIGCGVVQYESALRSADPLDRTNRLRAALRDFESALKADPKSTEARYNKIMTLYESGEHKEALREIDLYLGMDSSSVWAGSLKVLKGKIQATQLSSLDEEVRQAARARNIESLSTLVRAVPYRIPGAISSAMRDSLELQSGAGSFPGGTLESADLFWAARNMESVYSETTGDHSFRSFIEFYIGLSPPERNLKKVWDAEFQALTNLQGSHQYDRILDRSKIFESRYIQIKDQWQLAHLHHLRANSFYQGKADFSGAEAEYRKMLEIAQKLNAPRFAAKALGGLANITGMERKFDESFFYAKKLKALSQKYLLDDFYTFSGITLGNQYRRLGQQDSALRQYAEALGYACRMADHIKILEIYENSGQAMDHRGRLSEAKELYALAVQHREQSFGKEQNGEGMQIRHLNLLLRQGDLEMRLGNLDKAESAFSNCLYSIPSGMKELESRARIGMAEVWLQKGRFEKAENALNQAIEISESGKYADSEWESKYLKGRVLEATNRPQAALLMYQQSIRILGQMRLNVRSGNLKQAFLNDRYNPFRSLVGLLFRNGNTKGALKSVDAAKAATLKEDLSASIISAAVWNNRSAGEAAIIEYFFTNDGLLIFYTGQGRTEASLQKTSASEFSGQIDAFSKAVAAGDSGKFNELSRKLYQELLQPVEKYLFGHGSDNLVILPDGPLHLLPFAGLIDKENRYLIEKAALSYAPSRNVYLHCLGAGGLKNAFRDRVTLIDGSQGLPYAREELALISKLFGRNARSLGPGDLSLFQREVSNSTIVHFSGHSFLQEGASVLALQTAGQRIDLNSREISGWKMNSNRLVNLAGCATAIGPVAEGEAPWGLIPAFLNAGAPAVVASLMPVDDESTRNLDCRFYEILKKGSGKARALQSAQLALLEESRRRPGTGPQSWVPYILVGDPH